MSDYFDFAESLLGWLNNAPPDIEPAYILPYIQIRVSEFMGFVLSDSEGSGRFLNVEDGVLSDVPGMGLSFKLTDAQSAYLRIAIRARQSALFKKSMPASELKQLIHHLDVYIQQHASSMRERRSDALLFRSLDEAGT
jgi:hypothetical protein